MIETYLMGTFYQNLVILFIRNERNLYKNLRGNKVIFEEINHDLGLKFSYQWTTCDKYGFVKTSSIKNLRNNDAITVIHA